MTIETEEEALRILSLVGYEIDDGTKNHRAWFVLRGHFDTRELEALLFLGRLAEKKTGFVEEAT